jgi:ring-1,2-phenylacetyl-CoA epoxidase subunit PaaC
VVRLGDGTAESHARMQAALDLLWPYTGELFAADAVDEALAARQIAPRPDSLRPGWQDVVAQVLGAATLTIPTGTYFHKGGKRGVHTEHLGYILAEMQFLQRTYPGAVW